jgi:hypothetical protein
MINLSKKAATRSANVVSTKVHCFRGGGRAFGYRNRVLFGFIMLAKKDQDLTREGCSGEADQGIGGGNPILDARARKL